jgi:hypothetical protein
MDSFLMEWLILAVVTPLVIVVVVLLYGFVGCGTILDISEDEPPAPPPLKGVTNLSAKALGVDKIILSWLNDLPGVAKWDILRGDKTPPLVPLQPLSPIPLPSDVISTLFFDPPPGSAPLTSGTSFLYQVRALDAAGTPITGGLSNEARATTLPAAPVLEAVAVAVDKIRLKWTKPTGATKFKLQQLLPGGGFKDLPNSPAALEYTHENLPAGEYQYQVLAIVENGFVETGQQDLFSAPSNIAKAKPLAFQAAALTTEQNVSLAGYCLVQWIPSALLKNSGTKVRLTVRSSANGSVIIDKLYISQPAATGDLYDSLPTGMSGGLTRVVDKDLGDPVVVLPANSDPWPSKIIDYDLDPTKHLLIAFDFGGAGANAKYDTTLPGTVAYYKAATAQAADANRSPKPGDPAIYTPAPGRHYLIEKIEVF